MATEPPAPSQRVYRAACPNCGAPVDFRSASSAFAVCSFCNSSIVREGGALRKIGESAELFDDHSPLQLGASGKILGSSFTLVGRLQYRYAQGTWNEWHALFDNGPGTQRSGWLSEDNGRYVLTFDVPLTQAAPAADQLRVGAQQIVEGQPYTVASVNEATLIAPQGELPAPPVVDRAFVVADLRNARGEVGTLDYGNEAAPTWSIGRTVSISELAMTGLADSAEKTLSARSIECPNCGASIEVKLSSTQSVVCQQCHSVVDLTSAAQKNIGGALQHYAQDNGSEPLIPLGSVGTLTLTRGQALPWQVVGYAEVREVPEDADDEQTFWREYLLYNRTEGFAFIVDAEDGWSWTAPITGVPEGSGRQVKLDDVNYQQLYTYTGEVTYVLGEFYWQLTRNQRTLNTDYVGTGKNTDKRLNREQTGAGRAQEIVWSAGAALAADAVIAAFRLSADKKAAMQRDASPLSGTPTSTMTKIIVVMVVLFLILMLVRCSSSSNDCNQIRSSFGESSNEYRSCLNSGGGSGSHISGGAFGGFSSGGGHK